MRPHAMERRDPLDVIRRIVDSDAVKRRLARVEDVVQTHQTPASELGREPLRSRRSATSRRRKVVTRAPALGGEVAGKTDRV